MIDKPDSRLGLICEGELTECLLFLYMIKKIPPPKKMTEGS